MESIASNDPQEGTANIRTEFHEVIQHLGEDVKKVEEPRAQALFETAAEVLAGVDLAFKHYKKRASALERLRMA